MAKSDQYQKIVPFIFFTLALILLFLLIRPMIVILLSSILLSFLAFPLYKRINKKIPNGPLSIALSLVIIVIIVLVPFAFLMFGITQQAYYFYNSLSDNLAKGALFGFGCESAGSEVCLLLNQAERFSAEQLASFGVDEQIRNLLPVIQEMVTGMLLSVPLIIAKVFLTLIITYFLLKDWKAILKKVESLLPMRGKTIKRLFKEFGYIAHTVIYAQLFIAFVQGIIATIGYYLFGVPFPLFFGVLTAFFALIPTFGTSMIWAPASLYLMASGYFSHDYVQLGKGIGLFFYSLLIISTIDNLLLAKIVHTKAKVNQILIIVGVLGGAALFGVVGIFIGPILLPLLITYFETFKERFA